MSEGNEAERTQATPEVPPPAAQAAEPALPDVPKDARVGVPEARASRSRWTGLVWAVPLAALLIAVFLGVRAVADRGVDVIVTFDTGAGARLDDTKVIYQGVEAGRVTKIDVNQDGRRIDLTLRLDRRAEPYLTTTTKFWLVGAVPTLNDISSVKAALAGLSIGVATGPGGTPTRRFVGQNEPPIIMPGTPGTDYTLTTNNLRTVSSGSPIFYRGQQIGRVTGVHFIGPDEFRLDVFVLVPYDKLITPSAAFWVSSPVQVSLTDKGASASLEHVGALLNGAIEFDRTGQDTPSAQSAAGTEFPLYQSRREADSGPVGPEVPYAMHFKGAAGELIQGAPIRLLGFQIGAVRSVQLEFDAKTGTASTAVQAVLYPTKLHLPAPAAGTDVKAWQPSTDQAVNRLLAQGHRARLVQTPPVIGGRVISLDAVVGAGAATLGPGQPRSIPSDDTSGGIDEITAQLNQLLARFNRVPFESIGQDVQQVTARLSALVSSPQLADSLEHLNGTLAQADQMMHDVQPRIGPLVAKLDRAADEAARTAAAARDLLGGAGGGAAADANLPAAIQELSDAARSIRALADYLGRHPESLIRGRTAEPAAQPAQPAQPVKDDR